MVVWDDRHCFHSTSPIAEPEERYGSGGVVGRRVIQRVGSSAAAAQKWGSENDEDGSESESDDDSTDEEEEQEGTAEGAAEGGKEAVGEGEEGSAEPRGVSPGPRAKGS